MRKFENTEQWFIDAEETLAKYAQIDLDGEVHTYVQDEAQLEIIALCCGFKNTADLEYETQVPRASMIGKFIFIYGSPQQRINIVDGLCELTQVD